jgi:hypothetical protein
VDSLHKYLADCHNENISILPIGKLSSNKLSNILCKYENISFINKNPLIKAKAIKPCRIYSIFWKPFDVYGIKTLPKKSLKFDSVFNKYKKVSRSRPSFSLHKH